MENTQDIINDYLQGKQTPKKTRGIEDITNYDFDIPLMDNSIEFGRGYSPLSMRIPSPLKGYDHLFRSPIKKSQPEEQLTEYDLFSGLGDNTFDNDVKKLLSRAQKPLPDLQEELKSYGLEDEEENYGEMWKQTHKVIQSLPKLIKSNKEFEKYDQLLQSSIEKVIRQLKQQKSETSRLEQKIKSVNRSFEDLQRENRELRTKNERIERENQQLRTKDKDNRDLRIQTERLEAESRDWRSKNDRLERENLLLRESNRPGSESQLGRENELLRVKLLKYKNLYEAQQREQRQLQQEQRKIEQAQIQKGQENNEQAEQQEKEQQQQEFKEFKEFKQQQKVQEQKMKEQQQVQEQCRQQQHPQLAPEQRGDMFAGIDASGTRGSTPLQGPDPDSARASPDLPVKTQTSDQQILMTLQQQVNHLQHVIGSKIDPCSVCLQQMTANQRLELVEATHQLMGEYPWP